METDSNVDRARKRRDGWPEWKREFQLFDVPTVVADNDRAPLLRLYVCEETATAMRANLCC